MSKDVSKITTIWLSPELRQRARALGINISAVAREALTERVVELEKEVSALLDKVAAGDKDALAEVKRKLTGDDDAGTI